MEDSAQIVLEYYLMLNGCRQVRLVASGMSPLVYLVEEVGGGIALPEAALRQAVLNTQVSLSFFVCFIFCWVFVPFPPHMLFGLKHFIFSDGGSCDARCCGKVSVSNLYFRYLVQVLCTV